MKRPSSSRGLTLSLEYRFAPHGAQLRLRGVGRAAWRRHSAAGGPWVAFSGIDSLDLRFHKHSINPLKGNCHAKVVPNLANSWAHGSVNVLENKVLSVWEQTWLLDVAEAGGHTSSIVQLSKKPHCKEIRWGRRVKNDGFARPVNS
ncbi:hypothetical protein CEXT_140561 [Caerostris extrusa]|uniref:Uncharacterized protein n=1 Tax=Caerostris extrusa TaxID=172846 RepID=A0AAV4YBT1_CAEEX|nr:hypothetical protein CEXT_140561 [Caerostris extrusa]